MATTNFLQWNPNAINQETDAEYAADAQRSGGVIVDDLAPSLTMNKFYYQVSTFVAAFCQMMAQSKGLTNSDADLATLSSVLSNIVFSGEQLANIVSVAYSPTPVFNAGTSSGFQMTLTGNITSSTIEGVAPGQLLAFCFLQNAAGGYTVSWPARFSGALQPDPTPNAFSIILFRADLSGALHAVSPMISNNYTSLNALTLAAGAPIGAVLTGNGSIYAPVANGGFTSGNNSNGYWVKDPTGHIRQWRNSVTITGHPSPVSFPISFVNASSISVQINEIGPDGTYFQIYMNSAAPPTVSGFSVAGVSFSGPINLCWTADGY